MKVYELNAEQWLPVSVNEAWSFFSSPKNLPVITPPDLGFKIITSDTSQEIYKGMLLDYKVRPLFNISVKWQTEITEVNAPHTFVDKQLKGPYSLWEHHHKFVPKNGGVLVVDRVRYALPFGFIGTITHKLIVQKRLNDIFQFRRDTLSKLFP